MLWDSVSYATSYAFCTCIEILTTDTIIASSRFFDNDVNKVPKTAIIVGGQGLFWMQKKYYHGNGYNKACALSQIVEGSMNQMWIITALQLHPKRIIVYNDAATAELKVETYNYFQRHRKRSPLSLLFVVKSGNE